MAMHDRTVRLSESELNARYIAASKCFAEISAWRDYIDLADEFRTLDTYKDSAQLYARCIKAASAPAYREITEHIQSAQDLTAEDFREAARVMQLIQDYRDAREVMRVYTIKANQLTYEEAVFLLSNADATTPELERGVELLRTIKTFRDARGLLERFEKYYFERMYAEGMELMQNGHVYSEFEEAAAIFERIAAYSDAAEQAAACRKRAGKLRPRSKRPKEVPAAETPASDTATRIRPGKERSDTEARVTLAAKPRRRTEDETRNVVREVWRGIDKRRMVAFVIWLTILILDVYASIVLPSLEHEFFIKYANETRGITSMIAVFAAVMTVRSFLRMLTASMRRKLGEAALRALKKLAAPLIRAVNKMLMSIGIDLSRRGRLGGRDERTFVFDDEEKVKKGKRKLKNELKWQEQPDNAARVRFIFIDYMIRRIKGGYFMKRSMTPAEIGAEVATEDEQKLFRAYDMARYAGVRAQDELSDALVGELRAIERKHD